MNSATTAVLAALIIQVGLGLAVFQANPKRQSNQSFLILSLAIAFWLGNLYFAFHATNSLVGERSIRGASAAVPLILVGFNILRLSIRERRHGWRGILRHSRLWLIIGFAIVWLCQTKLFLNSVEVLGQTSAGTARLHPIYGPGFTVHAAYFGVGILALIFNYVRDLQRATGGERAELAFILIGATSTLAFSLLTNTVFRLFIEPAQLIWFAPFL